jgi:hypothetical protein
MILLDSSTIRYSDFLKIHVCNIRFKVWVSLALLNGVPNRFAALTSDIHMPITIFIFLIVVSFTIHIIFINVFLEFAARLIDIFLPAAPPHRPTPGTYMRATAPIKIRFLCIFLIANTTHLG